MQSNKYVVEIHKSPNKFRTYSSDISSEIIYPYIKEYFHHKNQLRSILQKIYSRVIISRIFRRNFSTANILIYPSEIIKNFIICGGNHSISIISLNEKSVTQILKYKYDQSLIKASISIRLEYPFLPAPKIIGYSFENNWIEQEWVEALPINRIKNKVIKKQALLYANKKMIELYENTIEVINLKLWIQQIYKDIQDNILWPEWFFTKDVTSLYKL